MFELPRLIKWANNLSKPNTFFPLDDPASDILTWWMSSVKIPTEVWGFSPLQKEITQEQPIEITPYKAWEEKSSFQWRADRRNGETESAVIEKQELSKDVFQRKAVFDLWIDLSNDYPLKAQAKKELWEEESRQYKDRTRWGFFDDVFAAWVWLVSRSSQYDLSSPTGKLNIIKQDLSIADDISANKDELISRYANWSITQQAFNSKNAELNQAQDELVASLQTKSDKIKTRDDVLAAQARIKDVAKEVDLKYSPALSSIKERQDARDKALWIYQPVSYQDQLAAKNEEMIQNQLSDLSSFPEWTNPSDLNRVLGATSQNIIWLELNPSYAQLADAKRQVARNESMSAEDKKKQMDTISQVEKETNLAADRYLQFWVDQAKKLMQWKTPEEAVSELDKEYLFKYWSSVSTHIRSAFSSFDSEREDQTFFKVKDLVDEQLSSVRSNVYQNSDLLNRSIGEGSEVFANIQRSYISPTVRRLPNTAQWYSLGSTAWSFAGWVVVPWAWLVWGAVVGWLVWWISGLAADIFGLWLKSSWSLAQLNNTSLLNIKLQREWGNRYDELANTYTDSADNISSWLIAFKWAWISSNLLTKATTVAWWFSWRWAAFLVNKIWPRATQSATVAVKNVWQSLDKWAIIWSKVWNALGNAAWHIYLENIIMNGSIQPGLSEMYTSDPMNIFFDVFLSAALEWIWTARRRRSVNWTLDLYKVIQSDETARKVYKSSWITNPTQSDLSDYASMANIWGSVIENILEKGVDWQKMLKYLYFQSEAKRAVKSSVESSWWNFKETINSLLRRQKDNALAAWKWFLAWESVDKKLFWKIDDALENLWITPENPVYSYIQDLKQEVTSNISFTDMVANWILTREGENIVVRLWTESTIIKPKVDISILGNAESFGTVPDYNTILENIPQRISQDWIEYWNGRGYNPQTKNRLTKQIDDLPEENPIKILQKDWLLFNTEDPSQLSDIAKKELWIKESSKQKAINKIDIEIQNRNSSWEDYQEIFLTEMSKEYPPEMIARIEKNNLYKNVFETYVASFPKDLFCI